MSADSSNFSFGGCEKMAPVPQRQTQICVCVGLNPAIMMKANLKKKKKKGSLQNNLFSKGKDQLFHQ